MMFTKLTSQNITTNSIQIDKNIVRWLRQKFSLYHIPVTLNQGEGQLN